MNKHCMPRATLSNRCMTGDLADLPVLDMLSWLHDSKRTGMIRVGGGLGAAVVFVKDGELFRAEWGHLRGEQVVYALTTLKQGAFMLIQRSIPAARPNVTTETSELLLRCAVALDEANRRVA